MTDIKRNERRRKHYQMLKEAGYDRETATKFKDYDYDTVMELCRIKREAMLSVHEVDKRVQARMESVLLGKKR